MFRFPKLAALKTALLGVLLSGAAAEVKTDTQLRLLHNVAPAVFNAELTTYAQAFVEDLTKTSLAQFVAPWVTTGRASGQFVRYKDEATFRTYETKRAQSGPRERMKFDKDDPYFNCKPHGLEIPTDKYEKEQAGVTGPVLKLMQSKIRMLLNAVHRSREYQFWTIINAAVSAAGGGAGNWSSSSVDPIKEINDGIVAINTATGMVPNRMAFGLMAWKALVEHPKVTARNSGITSRSSDSAVIAGMTLAPDAQIKVGSIPRNTAAKGLAKSNAQILGAEVYIFVGTETPDEFDPSFAKTFSTYGAGVDAVQTYFEGGDLLEIAAVDWSEDIQVTAPTAGYRLTLT